MGFTLRVVIENLDSSIFVPKLLAFLSITMTLKQINLQQILKTSSLGSMHLSSRIAVEGFRSRSVLVKSAFNKGSLDDQTVSEPYLFHPFIQEVITMMMFWTLLTLIPSLFVSLRFKHSIEFHHVWSTALPVSVKRWVEFSHSNEIGRVHSRFVQLDGCGTLIFTRHKVSTTKINKLLQLILD